MSTAIYARISKDAEQRGLGVERQLQDCAALAQRRGWDDVEHYIDNDVSASTGKRRPDYERLIEDVQRGRVKALVVWDIDRLTRRPAELEAFIDLADRHDLALASVGGEVDLSTPQGRLTARIKGAVARHEVEQASRRIKRKVEELAAAGLPFNGGLRPFGYDDTRLALVDAEADLIREAGQRVLAGDSLRSITRDWNARDVVTVTGKPWSTQSLKNVLTSPRIAGLVEHRGAVVGEAQWPAIVDAATHEALRHVLLDPARRTEARSDPRRYWWSGMVLCGKCNARMGCSTGAGRRTWRCLTDYGGCGKTSIEGKHLEPRLRALVLSQSYPASLARFGDADADRGPTLDAAIAGVEGRLEALAVAFAEDDEMDAAEYRAAARALRARLDGLRAERAVLTEAETQQRERPDLAALAEQFDGLSIERQRLVAEMLVERFLVLPGRTGRFDPNRVEAVWRFFDPAPVE